MFVNLDKEIGASKMSWRSVASAIGMSEATFRHKITKGNFSVEEAFLIKERVLPKFTLEYLFERTEEEPSSTVREETP